MFFIHWQPEFNTGLEIIDQQHRLLVDIINEIYQAHMTGKDRQKLSKLLNKLTMYAATHFAREEDYFDRFNYPDTEDHLKEHDYFEDTLYQFEEQFNQGKQDLSEGVLSFLSDWLISHINGSDRAYVPLLKKQGVK